MDIQSDSSSSCRTTTCILQYSSIHVLFDKLSHSRSSRESADPWLDCFWLIHPLQIFRSTKASWPAGLTVERIQKCPCERISSSRWSKRRSQSLPTYTYIFLYEIIQYPMQVYVEYGWQTTAWHSGWFIWLSHVAHLKDTIMGNRKKSSASAAQAAADLYAKTGATRYATEQGQVSLWR